MGSDIESKFEDRKSILIMKIVLVQFMILGSLRCETLSNVS